MADVHLNLEVKLEEFYKKRKGISVRFLEIDPAKIYFESNFIIGVFKDSEGRISKAIAMSGDTAASFAASWTNLPDIVVDEFHFSKELTEQLHQNLVEFFKFSLDLIEEGCMDEFVDLFQYPSRMPVALLPVLQNLPDSLLLAFEASVRTYREGEFVLVSSFDKDLFVPDLEDMGEELNHFSEEDEPEEQSVSVDQIQFLIGWGVLLTSLGILLWIVWTVFPRDFLEGLGVQPISPVEQMIEIEEALILPGVFPLGCAEGEDVFCDYDEEAHDVSLTYPISVMQMEVSQGLYLEVMGENPSIHRQCGLDCPVENVSWFDAVRFANRLSKNHKIDPCYEISGDEVLWERGEACFGWRLPTEAEWEIAARGGESYRFAGDSNYKSVGWLLGTVDDENFDSEAYAGLIARPHPSCSREINNYALCDMSGNVWEWVWDWYQADFYQKQASRSNPKGGKGNRRIIRGGAWDTPPRYAAVYTRIAVQPWSRQETVSLQGTSKENVEIGRGTIGFRLVRRLALQNRNTD